MDTSTANQLRGCHTRTTYARSLVARPIFQSSIIVAAILICYYYGFFGVARSDQLVYLYETHDKNDFWSLTFGAYAFNRSNSIGDFALFRPFLYFVLGLERWAWGYDFFLWQSTSIGLHIAVSLSLFMYFRETLSRKGTSFSSVPLILTFYFALLFSGVDMVIWHHIVGYLVFCLFIVWTAIAYGRFCEFRRPSEAIGLVVFSSLCCLTYELGNFLAVLLGLLLVARAIKISPSNSAANPNKKWNFLFKREFWVGISLIAESIGYVLWSWIDYKERFGFTGHVAAVHSFPLLRYFSDLGASLLFWGAYAFCPGALQLHPWSRIAADTAPVISTLALVNLVFALLLLGTLGLAAWWRREQLASNIDPTGLVFAVMAIAYGGLNAIGMIVRNGLEQGANVILSINTYYAYIFVLFLLLSLFHFLFVPLNQVGTGKIAQLRGTALFSIAAIAVIGGARIFFLNLEMYNDYARPIGNLVSQIEALRATHGKEPDFSFTVAPTCAADLALPWFPAYAKQHRSRYTIANVLFPDEDRDSGGKYIVDCDHHPMPGQSASLERQKRKTSLG